MIKKLSRKIAINLYPDLPRRFYDILLDKEHIDFPAIHRSYALTNSAKSFRGQITSLGREFQKLLQLSNVEEVVVMGDLAKRLLRQGLKNTGMQKIYQYFESHGAGPRFNGAFQVELGDLPGFISNLSWGIRTNAMIGEVYILSPSLNILATVCQYGNLHLYTLTQAGDKIFNQSLRHTGFVLMKGQACYDPYSKRGSIPGRNSVFL